MTPRTTWRNRRGGAAAALICALIATLSVDALAQTTRRPDDGRALDANPGVGSGGINAPVDVFQPNYANRYITGNITGLGSFRGFNPVRDPTLFRAGLGSAGLSFFQRQTVGLNDVTAGRTAAGQYYYGTSETVLNTGGILNQLNRPGSSTPYTTGLNTRDAAPLRPRTLRELAESGRILELTPGRLQSDAYLQFDAARMAQNAASPYSQALRSSLFGVRGSEPAENRAWNMMLIDPRYEQLAPNENVLIPESGLDRAPRVDALRTQRLRSAADAESLPADEGERQPLTTELRMRLAMSELERASPNFVEANATRRIQADLGGVDDNVLSGWISRAIDAEDDLRQAQFDSLKMRAAVMQAGAEASMELVNRPLSSLAGDGASPIDMLIARGEAALKSRRYYDAADIFQQASMLAPGSASPILERGFALFAAGDYRSSSSEILRGLSLFPDMASLRIELDRIIGDDNVIALRCEDLRRHLSRGEDFQLRFLLGYVEFNSGAIVSGLRNLFRAADDAPVDSIVRVIPEWIRGATQPGEANGDSPVPANSR